MLIGVSKTGIVGSVIVSASITGVIGNVCHVVCNSLDYCYIIVTTGSTVVVGMSVISLTPK